jgi:hypothetical protein
MRRAALVVLAIALAGCGDPPTHDEFVARANKVCDRHVGRLGNIAREGTSRAPLTERERRIWTEKYFDAYAEMVETLNDLDRPHDDPAVERFIARLEENVQSIQTRDFGRFDQGPSTVDLAQDADLEACTGLGRRSSE